MLRLLLIGWWAVMWAVPAAAQDATSTPGAEQNYIIGVSSEVLFPQAVRFVVGAARPVGELTEASLTIRPEGGPPLTVRVGLEAADADAPFAELAYVWPIPREAPPRLFQTIAYEWRLSSRSDGAARLAGSLVFTDQRVDWAARPDPGGQISLTMPAVGDVANVLGRLRRELQPVYDRLADEFNRRESFNFLIYPRDRLKVGCELDADGKPVAVGPFSRLAIPCDPAAADALFRASGYTVVESETAGAASVRAALVEALAARFYGQTWSALPGWFRAGLVELYRPDSKANLLPAVIAGARARRLFDLQTDAPDEPLWRAQSYALVVYIADQIGVEEVLRLAQAAGQAPFDAAYQAAMNRPLAALLPDFEQWIFTPRAEAAFAFTLYQPATPTPTATPTRTPTPAPTRTSTLERSSAETAGVTPTLPGRATFTPLPTATPTRTPTKAPPTPTPRPAGSLNTPTPQPQAAEALMQSPGGPLALAAVLLLVGAVLILTVSLLRRR